MQIFKDNYSVSDENSAITVAMLSSLGDREEQQDSAGFELKADTGLIVVCDGMGGHEGGKLASNIAVDAFLRLFNSEYPLNEPVNKMKETAIKVDKQIAALTHKDGSKMMSGATLTSVFVQKKELYWLSAGDSRIYIFRSGQMVRATKDHNYGLVLNEKLNAGIISLEQYEKEMRNKEALVSFLGVGNLMLMDSNDEGFALQTGDEVLLTSDGLCKVLSDEEICDILDNFSNVKEAVQALEQKVSREAKKKKIKRDNMTLCLIKIK